jgi:hypothetical protein
MIMVFWDMKPYSVIGTNISEQRVTSIFNKDKPLLPFNLKTDLYPKDSVTGFSETLTATYQRTQYHIPGFPNLILTAMIT